MHLLRARQEAILFYYVYNKMTNSIFRLFTEVCNFNWVNCANQFERYRFCFGEEINFNGVIYIRVFFSTNFPFTTSQLKFYFLNLNA